MYGEPEVWYGKYEEHVQEPHQKSVGMTHAHVVLAKNIRSAVGEDKQKIFNHYSFERKHIRHGI